MTKVEEVINACREFRNAVQDLLNSDNNTYDSRLKTLMYLITNDPILSGVLNEYVNKSIDITQIEELSGGWGKVNFPPIKAERIAYGLQVLKRESLKDNGMVGYAFTFFYKKNINAALRKVNEQLFTPVFRDVYSILDELQEKTKAATESSQKNSTHTEITGKTINNLKADVPIGFRIIDTRDNINARFYAKHSKQLLSLRNERSVIELLKASNSQEEFSYRLSSLATMIDHVNIEKLRSITGETDKTIKSIGLLEKYLAKIGTPNKDKAIKILRSISKLRQGYPVHGDQVDGLLEAHIYFKLEYPIVDHELAWITMLTKYLEALEIVLEVVKRSQEETA